MKAEKEKEQKKKAAFIAIRRLAAYDGIEVDFAAASKKLEIPERKLRKWATEDLELEACETLLANVATVSDTIPVRPKSEEPEATLTEAGTIAIVPSENSREHRVQRIAGGASGLQLLHAEVQATAGTIVQRIGDALEESLMCPKDLAILTTALTSIQQAFFNRPVTNIQVNNVSTDGESKLLKAFQKNLRA